MSSNYMCPVADNTCHVIDQRTMGIGFSGSICEIAHDDNIGRNVATLLTYIAELELHTYMDIWRP
jgi:hypothetical protein